MKRIYLGLIATGNGIKREIFRSEATPTFESHGKQFNMSIGPFRTVRGAKFMQQFGEGNPHCPDVASAERLGKKYAKDLV
jgi:hypothetical protein